MNEATKYGEAAIRFIEYALRAPEGAKYEHAVRCAVLATRMAVRHLDGRI